MEDTGAGDRVTRQPPTRSIAARGAPALDAIPAVVAAGVRGRSVGRFRDRFLDRLLERLLDRLLELGHDGPRSLLARSETRLLRELGRRGRNRDVRPFVAAAEWAAVHEQFADVAPVEQRADAQKRSADDHDQHRIAPADWKRKRL